MMPPQAAARLALEKSVLIRKHCRMVTTAKTDRKTNTTLGSLYGSRFPNWEGRNSVNVLL